MKIGEKLDIGFSWITLVSWHAVALILVAALSGSSVGAIVCIGALITASQSYVALFYMKAKTK